MERKCKNCFWYEHLTVHKVDATLEYQRQNWCWHHGHRAFPEKECNVGFQNKDLKHKLKKYEQEKSKLIEQWKQTHMKNGVTYQGMKDATK